MNECKICNRVTAVSFSGVCNDCNVELSFVNSLCEILYTDTDTDIEIAFVSTSIETNVYQINSCDDRRIYKDDMLGYDDIEFERRVSELLYSEFELCRLDGITVSKYRIKVSKYKL